MEYVNLLSIRSFITFNFRRQFALFILLPLYIFLLAFFLSPLSLTTSPSHYLPLSTFVANLQSENNHHYYALLSLSSTHISHYLPLSYICLTHSPTFLPMTLTLSHFVIHVSYSLSLSQLYISSSTVVVS